MGHSSSGVPYPLSVGRSPPSPEKNNLLHPSLWNVKLTLNSVPLGAAVGRGQWPAGPAGRADSVHSPLCTSSPATAQTHSRLFLTPRPQVLGFLLCVLPKHTFEATRGEGCPRVFWIPQHLEKSPLRRSKHEWCRPVNGTGAPWALHLHISLSPLLPLGPTSLFSYAPFDSSAGRAEDCRYKACRHP